ncbi:hypothetical protein RP726_04640 [Candidatus Methylospira mobilis]|uniref:hypothetical protein n=1 Tax=Candidatus Methylospira mobilis TaxID=1808979 RepID=UPI0028E55522|nr:hypothetical protein [Candidatus Methylospira mobilis]WNV05711.1 hypothetical protein RP726_04640 [Candidatus Methylospira mobilis]
MPSHYPSQEAHALIGEEIIVNKPDAPMHNKRGEICKVSAYGNRIRISVSFDGEIYNFCREEIILA